MSNSILGVKMGGINKLQASRKKGQQYSGILLQKDTRKKNHIMNSHAPQEIEYLADCIFGQ